MRAQDVVILGTGAFALEAMEAAHRAHARSITLITRARDRCSTVPRACICFDSPSMHSLAMMVDELTVAQKVTCLQVDHALLTAI